MSSSSKEIHLPDVVYFEIFKYLKYNERIITSTICRKWCKLAKHRQSTHSISIKISRLYFNKIPSWVFNGVKAFAVCDTIMEDSYFSLPSPVMQSINGSRTLQSLTIPSQALSRCSEFVFPALKTLCLYDGIFGNRSILDIKTDVEAPALSELRLFGTWSLSSIINMLTRFTTITIFNVKNDQNFSEECVDKLVQSFPASLTKINMAMFTYGKFMPSSLPASITELIVPPDFKLYATIPTLPSIQHVFWYSYERCLGDVELEFIESFPNLKYATVRWDLNGFTGNIDCEYTGSIDQIISVTKQKKSKNKKKEKFKNH